LKRRKPQQLFRVLGFQGDGALGAHQRFAGLVPREGMFLGAFRTLKNVDAFFTAETAFAAGFHLMGFVFGHGDILLNYMRLSVNRVIKT
jgi:hypothetical protein